MISIRILCQQSKSLVCCLPFHLLHYFWNWQSLYITQVLYHHIDREISKRHAYNRQLMQQLHMSQRNRLKSAIMCYIQKNCSARFRSSFRNYIRQNTSHRRPLELRDGRNSKARKSQEFKRREGKSRVEGKEESYIPIPLLPFVAKYCSSGEKEKHGHVSTQGKRRST